MEMSGDAFCKKDYKYFLAYIVPALAVFSIYMGGWWSLTSLIFIFVFIPLLEFLMSADVNNNTPDEEQTRSSIRLFDWLLYLNVPIVFGIIIWSAFYSSLYPPQGIEWFGYISALGILLGASGINVAHELGHRNNGFDRILAKLLLLPSHYMHFIIEHNLGHHKYVSTPQDPATARLKEPVYQFWVRSAALSYFHAWRIESKFLKSKGLSTWSVANRMIQFLVAQLGYNLMIFFFFGFVPWIMLFAAGVFSFLLLETINYIEHYGLVRSKLPSGRYEPVQPHHSWNADYPIGRILLYELTRHSDHHYKADRKYQILRSMSEAPVLPLGYPGSMLLALLPPVWFYVMNPKVMKLHVSVNYTNAKSMNLN